MMISDRYHYYTLEVHQHTLDSAANEASIKPQILMKGEVGSFHLPQDALVLSPRLWACTAC